jgi:hypothetical protein
MQTKADIQHYPKELRDTEMERMGRRKALIDWALMYKSYTLEQIKEYLDETEAHFGTSYYDLVTIDQLMNDIRLYFINKGA